MRRGEAYYAWGIRGLLLINPRSGSGRPSAEELADAAHARGIETRILGRDDDPTELALRADVDAVGVAGGDGSLAAVAAAAIERDVPFVCVPFGTLNHFARDVGLDRDDPLGALESFGGVERRVDVGRVADRLFLNNVSLGDYARLVHRRERHRRRRDALARLRALWIVVRNRGRPPVFVVDGSRVRARIVFVANNAYSLDLFDVGERQRLDEGLLHLYITHGVRRRTWEERAAREFTVDAPRARLRAAIDGEPAVLEPPLEFAVEPRALRVLLPHG